jgi:hypothetical protein
MMIAWEARREEREIVKRKLKAQGVKVSLLSASTITQHANEYLRRHAAELLAAAEASGAVQKLFSRLRNGSTFAQNMLRRLASREWKSGNGNAARRTAHETPPTASLQVA